MNAKLQQKLFKAYPSLFGDKDKSMKETAMCWGVDCGDGWFNLISIICALMTEHIEEHKESWDKFMGAPRFAQVKEKFGGLRLYLTHEDDTLSRMTSKAEQLSFGVCERCGSMNEVTQTTGWVYTRCKPCKEKLEGDDTDVSIPGDAT